MMSLYGAKQDFTYNADSNDSVDTPTATNTPKLAIDKPLKRETITTEEQPKCNNVSQALLELYPSSSAFKQAHQNIIDQLILKNTEISQGIRDKVITSLGLHFVVVDQTFSSHLRLPKTTSLHAETKGKPIGMREMLLINRSIYKSEFTEAQKSLSKLLQNVPSKRLSMNNKSMLTTILDMHHSPKTSRAIGDLFINSGYQPSLGEIADAIAGRLNDTFIIQLLNAYGGDKNAIFDLSDGTYSTNLLLHSLKHNKLIVADHLLSQGVRFSTNVKLQQDHSALFELIDSRIANETVGGGRPGARELILASGSYSSATQNINKTRNALQNLLESGVLLFDTSLNVQDSQVFETLTKTFGEESAKQMISINLKDNLLSPLEQEIALTLENNFIERALALLPSDVKNSIADCTTPFINNLYATLEQQHNAKINSLYRPLVRTSDEVEAITQKRHARELDQASIDALVDMTSFAAKTKLEDIVKWQARKKRIETMRTQQRNSEKMGEKFLEDIVNGIIDDGIEASLEKIESVSFLSEAEKNVISLQLAFYFSDDLAVLEALIRKGIVLDDSFIDTILTRDNAALLRMLFENGTPINRLGRDKRNMLFSASSASARKVFDLLLSTNIELKPISNLGYDALDIALLNIQQSGDFYFADRLLQSGFEILPSHVEILRDLAGKHYSKVAGIIEQYDVAIKDEPEN